jgi:hypothetical protein
LCGKAITTCDFIWENGPLIYCDRYIIYIPPPVVWVGEHCQSGEGASLRLPLRIHHCPQWWPFEVGWPAPQDNLAMSAAAVKANDVQALENGSAIDIERCCQDPIEVQTVPIPGEFAPDECNHVSTVCLLIPILK